MGCKKQWGAAPPTTGLARTPVQTPHLHDVNDQHIRHIHSKRRRVNAALVHMHSRQDDKDLIAKAIPPLPRGLVIQTAETLTSRLVYN